MVCYNVIKTKKQNEKICEMSTYVLCNSNLLACNGKLRRDSNR